MVAEEEEEEEGFLKGPRGENIMRGEEGGIDSRDSCMIPIIFQSYFCLSEASKVSNAM